MNKNNIMTKALEWFGVITAIIYSLILASNTGYEVLGFTLLFISALAIGDWHCFVTIMEFYFFSFSMQAHEFWYVEMVVKS